MAVFPAMCVRSGACAAYPDVCLTFAGTQVVPLPYNNTADPADGDGTPRVRIMNSNALRLRDEMWASKGDEAGIFGGVVSGTHLGVVRIETASAKVFAGGLPLAYHTCATAHNGTNANVTGGLFTDPSQVKVLVEGALPPGLPVASAGNDPLQDLMGYIGCSELLQKQIEQYRADGGLVQYGPRGGGSGTYKSRSPMLIELDPLHLVDPLEGLYTVAHELGHALYVPGPLQDAKDWAWQPDATGNVSYERFIENIALFQFGQDEGAADLNAVAIHDDVLKRCPGFVVPLLEPNVEPIARSMIVSEEQKRLAIARFYLTHIQSGSDTPYGETWKKWVGREFGFFSRDDYWWYWLTGR